MNQNEVNNKINPEPTENSNENSQKNLIDVIVTTTKIEVLLDLIQKIDFNTVNRILDETPKEFQHTANYKVLLNLVRFNSKLQEIFISPEDDFTF